ncbi:MAG: TetR family transcriptional regulator [Actinomycetales bacterium]|nr:MAG: TetR family transcriptional regulator [Actinomycetales bacterium]
MTTRAQLSQERSRLRRDELVAAAIELFAEGGARAVTHRAVARRAGLPPATTTYYFASIEELLREALRDHIGRWRASLDTLAGFDSGPRTLRVSDVTPTIVGVFSARGPEVAALELSIYLAATRDEALRDEAASALRSFEQLTIGWLTALGVPAPERLAGALLTAVAGTALRRQSGLYSETEEAERMSETLRDLVGAHLLGRDVIDGALAKATGASLD